MRAFHVDDTHQKRLGQLDQVIDTLFYPRGAVDHDHRSLGVCDKPCYLRTAPVSPCGGAVALYFGM